MTGDNQDKFDVGDPSPDDPQSQEDLAFDREWSEADVEHLKAWYGVKDDHFLARELKRDPATLRDKAWEVFLSPVRTGPWTKSETDGLKAVLGVLDVSMIGRMIGRSPEDIDRKIIELGTTLTAEALSSDDLVRFKRLYGTRADEDLALVFGRLIDVIEGAGRELCLSKDKAFLRRTTGGAAKTRMPRWSQGELGQLGELYPKCSNLEIAQALGRSVKSVVSKAHNLGLKKDKARLQQMGRQNVKLRYERPNSDGEGGANDAGGPNGAEGSDGSAASGGPE